jgi:hypothetical protein
MSDQDTISAAVAGIRSRLDILTGINEANIFIPGGPQAHYHQLIAEAYSALLLIEQEVDMLRETVTYQHRRLDEIREAALAQKVETEEQLIAFRDED